MMALPQYRIVADSDNTAPMFTWAAWRVLDAADRTHQLEALVEDAARRWSSPMHARVSRNDAEGAVDLYFAGVNEELEKLARPAITLASEVIHHARAALDYCAHHAAWMDSGERNEWTQFPLTDTRSKWKEESRGRRLRGVSPKHLAWIDEVQPYRPTNWSAALKRLSNHDKHRVGIQILPAYQITADPSRLTPDPLGDPDFVGLAVQDPTLYLLIGDAFVEEDSENRPDAVPLLWEIIKGVTGVVNRFLEAEGNNPIIITRTASG